MDKAIEIRDFIIEKLTKEKAEIGIAAAGIDGCNLFAADVAVNDDSGVPKVYRIAVSGYGGRYSCGSAADGNAADGG